MESKRLFVGNLPVGITEDNIRDEFSLYGDVESIEIKRKENLVDLNNPNIFAFICLRVSAKNLSRCFNDFANRKYFERILNISIAKESFLDRLKREREEQIKTCTPVKNQEPKEFIRKKNLKNINIAEDSKHKVFKDAEIVSNNIDTSFKNDKTEAGRISSTISIEGTNAYTKQAYKSKDDLLKNADIKRIQSLDKMITKYEKQKFTIQQALSSVDANNQKHIVFDEEEEEDTSENKIKIPKTLNVFDDTENDSEGYNIDDAAKDFELKNQFEGKKGEELMKLQSKFNLDSRFKMDTRFIEEFDEVGSNTNQIQKISDKESERQMGIIEKIVGKKMNVKPKSIFELSNKLMFRFDPSKEQHQKFIQSNEQITNANQDNHETRTLAPESNEVSKKIFYSVNENLTSYINTRGDGFSLLSMLGRSENSPDEKEEQIYSEKILVNKSGKTLENNPFHFDSSDSEDNIENKFTNVSGQKETTKKSEPIVWSENFFIFGNDQRFKDGKSFFKSNDQQKKSSKESYDLVKDKLRLIINKKIIKSKRNSKKGNFKRVGISKKSKFK